MTLSGNVVLHLLADVSPLVRQAVFEANLPRLVEDGGEREKLLRQGLADNNAKVRLAALKTVKPPEAGNIPGLRDIIKELAADDADPEVRAAAKTFLDLRR
jgi:hypothetical protein